MAPSSRSKDVMSTLVELPRRKRGMRSLLILGSGLLMGLAPAPISLWPLAWIALAPLWVVLVNLTRSTSSPISRYPGWQVLRWALLWGLGYHGLALSWIVHLHPLTWMGIPWLGSIAIALFAWGFITLWGSALVMLWATLFTRIGRSSGVTPGFRLLLGVALWCGTETLCSWSPLDWSALSYTQSPHNLAILHLGQLSGPFTITAAIVAVNGLLAEAWLAQQGSAQGSATSAPIPRTEQPHRPTPFSRRSPTVTLLLAAVSLWLGVHTVGALLYRTPLADQPAKAVRIGVIQGNVPTRVKLTPAGVRQALKGYTDGYNTLVDQGVDVVLTPEGAIPEIWRTATQQRNPLYQAILNRGVPAWIGTFALEQDYPDYRITQSLLTLGGEGQILSRYNKVKLVPLGEYIPLQSILGQVIRRLSPLETSMVPGRPNQQFLTPFGQAAVGICYDSAYSELFRLQIASGGEFILTASNNDPYPPRMMIQHHAHDVMRAIETSRWTVRATNTGLSGLVTPHGQALWISKPNTYTIYAATIYRREQDTLYVLWGNWITPLLLGSTMAVFLGQRIKAYRSRAGASSQVP